MYHFLSYHFFLCLKQLVIHKTSGMWERAPRCSDVRRHEPNSWKQLSTMCCVFWAHHMIFVSITIKKWYSSLSFKLNADWTMFWVLLERRWTAKIFARQLKEPHGASYHRYNTWHGSGEWRFELYVSSFVIHMRHALYQVSYSSASLNVHI